MCIQNFMGQFTSVGPRVLTFGSDYLFTEFKHRNFRAFASQSPLLLHYDLWGSLQERFEDITYDCKSSSLLNYRGAI